MGPPSVPRAVNAPVHIGACVAAPTSRKRCGRPLLGLNVGSVSQSSHPTSCCSAANTERFSKILIPGAQNLARDPGMGRLADGEDAGRLAAKQHEDEANWCWGIAKGAVGRRPRSSPLPLGLLPPTAYRRRRFRDLLRSHLNEPNPVRRPDFAEHNRSLEVDIVQGQAVPERREPGRRLLWIRECDA